MNHRTYTVFRLVPAIALLAACEQSVTVAPNTAATPEYGRGDFVAAQAQPMGASASTVGATVVANGGYELNGGVNSASFANWTVVNRGSGSWVVSIGQSLSGYSVPAPSEGHFAAMTTQGGGGDHILYQDVTIPAGASALSFDVAINNRAGAFYSPASLSSGTRPNQQFRADIISPSADLYTVGTGVLMNLYQTHSGDALTGGYHHVTVDVSSLAGQTVRIRFAEADNQLFFQAGVDNVSIVSLDNTPPVITPVVTGTLGDNDWYTSDVNVAWTVSDAESAITSAPCAAGSVTANTAAATFSCSATSGGGTSSASVTVKRDATAPTVAYTGNAGSYSVDQSVSISCSASDDLSGVASSTCASVSGAAYTFSLGSNTFSASAKDNAGNVGTGSTTFAVTVNEASLCTLTQRFVTKAGVANSMCAKLNAAAASLARGDATARAGQLNAYANDVQAQTDKSVSAANAAILLQLVAAM